MQLPHHELLAPIAARLGQLIRLLDSDRDGEVISAARALGRTLRAAGADFHLLAETVGRGAAPEERTAPCAGNTRHWRGCADWLAFNAMDDLNEREREFVSDLRYWGNEPTKKQAAWLRRLYDRERARE
jgi:hypothetical protein